MGIKPGYSASVINMPAHYFSLFTDLPADVDWDGKGKKNFIHLFVKELKELEKKLPVLMKQIEQDGMIWVSWPKKASKVPTDITEDHIRNYALKIGLVDVKVCAVDEVWSGLKLVIPLKDREKTR